MKAMSRVAKRAKCTIILSRNLKKDTTQGALAAGRGSGELGNAARFVLHCQSLPRQVGTFGLAVAACNAGEYVPTIEYKIENVSGYGRIKVTGYSSITADELLGGEEKDLDRSLIERAKSLIREMIPSGKLDSRVVKAKAEAAMISIRTLQQAAKILKIEHSRAGSREETVEYWHPPKGGWR